ncbi:MAG: choice-of-anchor Q domain-containing protein [Planctomycetota bacterium]
MPTSPRFLPLVLALLFVSTTARAADIYVTPAGGGDGSKGNPTDLQSALDTAASNGLPDDIYLEQGTYDRGSTPWRCEVTAGDGSVRLLGGWSDSFGVRSDDPSLTVLDGNETHRVIEFVANGATASATVALENLTVSNGYSDDAVDGAGIRAVAVDGGTLSLELEGCRIRDNDAVNGEGGGVFARCRLDFADVRLHRNRADLGGALAIIDVEGGDQTYAPSIRDCVFEENTSVGGTGGSAVYNEVSPIFERCTFLGRSDRGSVGNGSAVDNKAGANFRAYRCTFSKFTTENRGSVISLVDSMGEIRNCLFTHCRAGASGTGQGTVVSDITMSPRWVHITNCTFVDCQSSTSEAGGGAIYFRENSFAHVTNTIVRDCGTTPILNDSADFPKIQNCLVPGGLTGSGMVDKGGNLVATGSPFVADNDFRLATGSIAIDAGTTSVASVGTEDLLGNGRLFDGDGNGTATVDMGPYEFCPDVSWSPAAIDFGDVDRLGESPPVTVTVLNRGQAPLAVGTVGWSGDDWQVFEIRNDNVGNTTILPYGSATFDVVMVPANNPTAALGDKTAYAFVSTNDPDDISFSIALTGRSIEVPPPPPSINPTGGTLGTLVTIRGSDFGTKKPRVWLAVETPTGKVKKSKLKVATWSDAEITAYVKKKTATGAYPLMVQPKEKGAEAVEVGVFTIAAPEIHSLAAADARPGTRVTMKGGLFGPKQARVKVYFDYTDSKGRARKKRLRIDKSTMSFEPKSGISELVFLLPKLPGVTGDIRIRNRIGEFTFEDSVTIEGD